VAQVLVAWIQASSTFEGGEERLDGGVVVAVAGGAEGLVDLELDDPLGERQGGVGGAAVGVVYDSSIWPAAVEGHDEGRR
jgi:hypothetical protein